VPYGDPDYYRLRPSLAIQPPDATHAAPGDRSLDLDGFFGLHPSLAPLLLAWQDGHLALVHAVGAPDDSRSHFRSMELMERGASDESGPASGWLSRVLAASQGASSSPLRAVAWGDRPPRSLLGSVPVTTLQSIADAHLGSDGQSLDAFRTTLAALYQPFDDLGSAGQDLLGLLGSLDRLRGNRKTTAAAYPQTDFGRALEQTARLVMAGVGLEVAALELGGWDTHFAQGGSQGIMATLLVELATGLAAFVLDLGAEIGRVTTVTMSEFGRRAYENGSLGTDHGHGSCMFVLGGRVNGRRVVAHWPGLGEGELFGPGDLAVTTDYRDVLAEICRTQLSDTALGAVFPGRQSQPVGVMR
jgi:uncharacterized protein (DUF1501 family)